MKRALFLSAIVAALPAAASAAILPYSVTASGAVTNSLSLLSDGVIPANMTRFNAATNVVYGDPTNRFTFSFSSPVAINSVLASVDNNDDYIFDFYNGATLLKTAAILAGDGTVTAAQGGLETFDGALGTGYTYLPSLTFAVPVTATSAVLRVGNSDNLFGVGEIQFNGTPVRTGAVPEPASWAMFIGGFGLVGGALRSRKRTAVRFA